MVWRVTPGILIHSSKLLTKTVCFERKYWNTEMVMTERRKIIRRAKKIFENNLVDFI